MGCKVISIARALGANAEEIGREVAQAMNFRYVDDEIVVRAAEKAGVSPETIQRAEHTPGLIERILQNLGNTPIEAGAFVPPPVETSAVYESLIEQVVREVASAGDVVIVAHGASIPLAGSPGLLRVFVSAPPDLRASRLAAASKMDDAWAKKAVATSDKQRAAYLQRFYGVQKEQPTHYDIVLNTEHIAAGLGADLITAVAKRM